MLSSVRTGVSEGVEVACELVGQAVALTSWRCLACTTARSEEHSQSWHCIAFVQRGAFVFHSRRGSSTIDQMSLGLFNPGEPYQTTHPFGCGDQGGAVVLTEECAREIVALYDPAAAQRGGGVFAQPAVAVSPQVHAGLSVLQRRHRAAPGDALAAEELALLLAGAAIRDSFRSAPRGPARSATVSEHRQLIEESKALLQAAYRAPLRLETIARTLGVSPYHLCHVFARGTGMTLHRYLVNLRLRAAVEAILDGCDDLSGLALEMGFSNHSHFTSSFRQVFGVPPSGLREASSQPLRPLHLDKRASQLERALFRVAGEG